jgi:hypothetical protein
MDVKFGHSSEIIPRIDGVWDNNDDVTGRWDEFIYYRIHNYSNDGRELLVEGIW